MPHCLNTRLLGLLVLLATPARADQWDTRFGSAIPDAPTLGPVMDILVEGNDLYAVGNAYNARVARWNGTNWLDLGASFTWSTQRYVPLKLGRYKQWLVVTGIYYVNGQPGDIALWDGTTWSALQTTVVNIHALYSDADYLYFAGRDDQANYGAVRRWDGTTETAIPLGTLTFTSDLVDWNGDLYAAGSVSGVGARIEYWDGTQWNPMPSIAQQTTRTLTVYNNELYASGYGVASVRKWDGSSWISVAPNLETNGQSDIIFHGGRLYLGSVSWPLTFRTVAMLKDGAWNTMNGGAGPYGDPRFEEYQGRVLVGGEFASAGGMESPGLALWDGDRWRTRGLDGGTTAITSNGSNVFVAGIFNSAFDTPAQRIARWDGSTWSALGSGIDGTVHCATMVGNDLYVGGEFTDAGGSGAVNLARWDGTVWSAVGASLQGPVYALATDGTDLYVGGDFETLQGDVLLRVARFDGSAFHALGTGISNGSVRSIKVNGAAVYVAGDFTTAGGTPTGNTAIWDGSWRSLGLGINGGMVRALEMYDGTLYAGGDFYSYPFQRLAYFDGTQWVAIFPGLDGAAYSLASMAGRLYITGSFTKAGGDPANRIVVWNGASFSTLGSGLDRTGRALAAGPQGIWVGGDFQNTGDIGASYIGHYILTPTAVSPSVATLTSLETIFPNPFNPSTSVRYRVGTSTRVTLAIYDVKGRLVRRLFDGDVRGSAAEHVVTWEGIDDRGQPVASGVYFVRMHTPSFTQSRKMVLLK